MMRREEIEQFRRERRVRAVVERQGDKGPSTWTELKVIAGSAGAAGGFGFAVGETAFSTAGTGVDSWAEAVCQIEKLIAMESDDPAEKHGARKTLVYLAERTCNASNRRARSVRSWGRITWTKRMSYNACFPEIGGNFGGYPAPRTEDDSLRLSEVAPVRV